MSQSLCIYCRAPLSDDPTDPMYKSEEHIVAMNLGGSSGFATWDASRKYNSELGSTIDAPFSNFLPIAIKRHELSLVGQGGAIPPIKWRGKSEDNGEPITVTIDRDGNVTYQFDSTVIREKRGSGEEFLIGGSPEKVSEILQGLLRKAHDSNQRLFAMSGRQIQRIDELDSHATTELTTEIGISLSFDLDDWVRGIFKILLGLGHVVLGPNWTFSASGGDLFRSVLFSERKHWPANSLRGFMSGIVPPEVRNALGITSEVCEKQMHTIAVVPHESDLVGVVSLFGGRDIPAALVTMGSERGRLASVNGTLPPNAQVGVRIDPTTRQTTPIRVADLMQNIV